MNQIRMQLDNESRNLAAATDDNIHLKAHVEALHSKSINLEAKVKYYYFCCNQSTQKFSLLVIRQNVTTDATCLMTIISKVISPWFQA